MSRNTASSLHSTHRPAHRRAIGGSSRPAFCSGALLILLASVAPGQDARSTDDEFFDLRQNATAREILAVARTRSDLRDDLMLLVHERAPHLLTDQERLDVLLGRATVEIEIGPGIFEVDLTRPETLTIGTEDLEFLRARSVAVTDRLLADLEARGSRRAAVFLAWLGERRALPELRRRLLSEADTYGWETSTPTLFSEGNHRGYHAYSRAIEHLTGEALDIAVGVRPEEIRALAGRNDDTALMLLYRLAPRVAGDLVCQRFRAARKTPEGCRIEGNTIRDYDFVQPGIPLAAAWQRLGPPDRQADGIAFYCCGDAWSGDFRLRFAEGQVLAFESEARDGDGGERWCRGHEKATTLDASVDRPRSTRP